ncbi:MAG: polysaccharide biosynthesis C-terminal domain-containing protein, partial [Candidatus Sericytochromatia bacterium]
WLSKPMGVGGVALASSLAAGLNFVVLAWLLRRRIGVWMQRESWLHLGKIALASLPMAILGYFSYQALVNEPSRLWMVLRSGSDSLLLSLVYGLLLLALKDREILQLLRRFRKKGARA